MMYNIFFDNSINFFFYLFLIQIIIISNYYIIIFHKFNNYIIINILLIVILLFLYIIVYYEFSKFFYVLNFFADSELILKTSQKKFNKFQNFSETDLINKTRTLNYYLSLFILLKF